VILILKEGFVMTDYPPVPFKVIGIEEFNFVPIVKGQVYTITDISDDGTRWETMGPDGKPGWFPARMCEPIRKTPKSTNQTPVVRAPVQQVTAVKNPQPRQAATSPQVTPQQNRSNPTNTNTQTRQGTQPRQVEPRQQQSEPRQQQSEPRQQQSAKSPTQTTPSPQHKQEDFNVDDILANFKGFDDI
jgi:hypothetical protein